MREASNKLLQLRVAVEVGLTTPKSVFTNDAAVARQFAEIHPEIVIKPLHAPFAINEASSRATTRFMAKVASRKSIEDYLLKSNSIVLFGQSKVSKTADIRANILPAVSLCCLIDSGQLSDVDWRPATLELPHRTIEMPEQIERRCRQFLSMMNLKWGAFDFGIDKSGEWIFFECNPNGQWLWLELKTQCKLSQAFAEELVRHHSRSVPN
jgi:hypothetical protein